MVQLSCFQVVSVYCYETECQQSMYHESFPVYLLLK